MMEKDRVMVTLHSLSNKRLQHDNQTLMVQCSDQNANITKLENERDMYFAQTLVTTRKVGERDWERDRERGMEAGLALWSPPERSGRETGRGTEREEWKPGWHFGRRQKGWGEKGGRGTETGT